jgi:hypothetical protein
MRALIFLALVTPALAEPVGTHPFPWLNAEQLLRKLEHPSSRADSAQAVAYLQGVMEVSANRSWCYSVTKPSTALLQPALTDKLRSLTPSQAKQSAAVLAVQAWQEKWPCAPRCCHV